MMAVSRIAFFMLWLLSIQAKTIGQLNTLDTTRLILKLSIAGSLLEGNISRLLLVNRMDIIYSSIYWGISNRTDYQYGKRNNMLSENDLVVYQFLYYRPAGKFYPFLMAIAEPIYVEKSSFAYSLAQVFLITSSTGMETY
jgi:hypothetical protein